MNKQRRQIIIPVSLVPSATGTGFLIFGSQDLPCHIPLGYYLLVDIFLTFSSRCQISNSDFVFQVAGSISLSIPILASVFKFLVRRFYANGNGNGDPVEKWVFKAMSCLSSTIVTVEILILIAGMIVILPHLGAWQYQDRTQIDTYCDLSLMLFSLTFLSGAWLFIITGLIIFSLIYYSNLRSQKEN